MTEVTALLERLLEVTPPVPSEVASDALIAAAEDGMRRRRELIVAATCAMQIESPHDVALFAELRARQQAWHDTVARAHAQVGNQLLGTRRARAYAVR